MLLTFMDFETATGDRASACSLGLAVLDGREVVERRSWLIRPPGNRYDGMNIAIHGITPAMTRDAPDFDSVWAQVRPYLDGGVAVAHNASFDLSVLRHCLAHYGVRQPQLRYYCTLVLSRAVAPGMPSYRLDSLCSHFGIAFRHHDAEEDAWAASRLLVELLELAGARDIADLAEAHGVGAGAVHANGYLPCRAQGKRARGPRPEACACPAPGQALRGKAVALAGPLESMSMEQAAQAVVRAGGTFAANFTRRVAVLVVGGPGQAADRRTAARLLKAEQARASGRQVELLSEAEFLKRLS